MKVIIIINQYQWETSKSHEDYFEVYNSIVFAIDC